MRLEKIEDLMTKQVVTVTTDTPLAEAVISLVHHSFTGLPVVDKDRKVVGLFTEQKLLTDRSYVHLRTLVTLFSDLKYYKKNKSAILEQLKNIVPLKIGSVMNPSPTTINHNTSIEEAHQRFLDPEVHDPVLIVDADNFLKGVVSLSDFSKYYHTPMKRRITEEDINRKIDRFADAFKEEFMVVPRFRVYTWMITSIIFGLAGFSIAMFFILRISA